MTAVDRFQEGQLVGRYRIVQLIGEGGMGAVYEAIHPGLKKRVAIKVLLPRIADNHDARVRFLREGEAASRISHPNVVSVFDVGEDNGVPYLVMEYLEGQTLGDLLSGRDALELVHAVALSLPIMAAVAAGHECGVVHRDLKPQNIFLAQGRWGELTPKVLDFGVSKLIDHEGPPVTRTETMLGTACYMSPEQARGARNVDARSDQFTLGLILYEMLTGRRAYRGENDLEVLYNAAGGTIQPARELRPGLPEPVYALLSRMLAVSPSDRYAALRDAARVLSPFAGERTRTTLAKDLDAVAHATPDGVVPLGSSGTAVYPVIPERGEDTTLRHAAVESKRRKFAGGRRRAAGARLAAGLGAAAVALALFVVLRAGRPGSEPTPAVAARQAAPAVVPIEAAIPHPVTRPAQPPSISASPSSPSPTSEASPPSPTSSPPSPTSEPSPPSPTSLPSPPTSPPFPTSEGSAGVSPSPLSGQPADRDAPFEIRAFPPEATLVLDGRQPRIGSLQLVLPLAGSSHELRVSAPGYAPRIVSFSAHQPPPAQVRLARVAAPTPRTAAKKVPHPTHAPMKRGTNDALIIK